MELDDDVLDAARELAHARRQTIGHVVSSLARAGLRPTSVEIVDGLPVIRARGQVITSEMVRRAADDQT